MRPKRSSFYKILLAGLAMVVMAACSLSLESAAPPEPSIPSPEGPLSPTLPPLFPTREPGGVQTPAQPAGQETLIRAYFSSPGGEASESGALEEKLLADLDSAAETIDVAMYNFNLRRVEAALIAAHRRGVRVRYVTDSDDLADPPVERMVRVGIPVRGDEREPLMHNKFIVIDRRLTWTGSLNLTGQGAYQDNNNFVRLDSPDLADDFTAEFEEMFLDDMFGPDSPADTPFPKVSIGGVPVEALFAPEDRVSRRLVQLLREAQTSIDFLAYSFTSDPLAEAMLDAAQSGVAVRGVFDEEQFQSNTGTEYNRLRRAKIPVRLDGNSGLMHHKLLIIDRQTVVFGSYNFSNNADRKNDENVVVVTDRAVAEQFLAEFEHVYAQA